MLLSKRHTDSIGYLHFCQLPSFYYPISLYSINFHLQATLNRMKPIIYLIISVFSIFSFTSCQQPAANSSANGANNASSTAGMAKNEGFFNFYWDDKEGKILLEIDELEQEFIYVSSLATGLGSNDIGLDRGQLGATRLVKFVRSGPKVLLQAINTDYRAVSDNPLEQQSVEQAFAQAILGSFKIVAEENGTIRIDITDFLLRDAHGISQRLKSMKEGDYSVDKDKSAIYMPKTKAFPRNTEFEAITTFTGSGAGRYLRSVLAENSGFAVRQHHSFVALPEDGYQPRKFDPRAGYFATSYADYAQPIDKPLDQKLITRHRLEKEDPSAERSAAKEPIIYYLDAGVPEPVRSALLDGAAWWNEAFEALGYDNAFQVAMLPDDADPLDVRYNVIQWVHRSTRGWSYGASVKDPRTGEILKGHVSLGSLRVRQDLMIAEALLADYEEGKGSDAMESMALARLRQLSAHEVGHTIGLAHNFAASPNDASVMDYPHPKITLDEDGNIQLDEAYAAGLSNWDKLSIAYGYESFEDEASEEEGLKAILSTMESEGLMFISDRDARAEGGAHAYAHLWDNAEDAGTELEHLLKVRQVALDKFSPAVMQDGLPYSQLENYLVPIYLLHRYQVEAAVKLVGGLNYNYGVKPDALILEPVPAAMQQAVLDQLLEAASASTLTLPEHILATLPPQASGYGRDRESFRGRTGLTFDPLAAAESGADLVFGLLLHPERAERLISQQALHADLPGLEDVLEAIENSSFSNNTADTNFTRLVQQRIAFVALHHMIHLAQHENAGPEVKALLHSRLKNLQQRFEKGDTTQQYFSVIISQFIDNPDEYSLPEFSPIPPGAPIGG